jgi:hypothetical protein
MGRRFVLPEIIHFFVLITLVWLMISFFLPKILKGKFIPGWPMQRERLTAMAITITSATMSRIEKDGSAWRTPLSWIGDAVERNPWRIRDRCVSGNADRWWEALFLHSGPAVFPTIENALGRIIAMLSFICSVGNIPLASLLWAGWHQLRRRDFVYLRRFDCHSDRNYLCEILRSPRRCLDHRDLLHLDGSRGNYRRSHLQRIRIDCAGSKTAKRDRIRAHHLE